MPAAKNDILQGTLTLLVLKTLSRGPAHGYSITQHIRSVSHDLLRVEEGSLYPALHRMEQEGWLRAEWSILESKRRARVYSLTAAGLKKLEDEQQNWTRLTSGVAEVLRFA